MELGHLVRSAFAAGLLAASAPAAALPPVLSYQFAVPAGWTRTDQGGVIFLMPAGEPPGSVVLSFLPLVPRQGNLDAQVTSLRTGAEARLGLRQMREASSQRAAGPGFERRMHAAAYSSDAGERRLVVLAHAEGGMFGGLLFITTSDGAYERVGDAAFTLFNGLRLSTGPASPGPAAVAARGTPPPGVAAPPAPVASGGASAGGYRGQGIVGVWAGTRTMRDFSMGFSRLISLPAWYVFFDDGQLLQTFPEAGLAGFDRAAFRARYPREWHVWTLDGVNGTVQRQEGAAPWTLLRVGPNHLKVDGESFHRCPDVDGLQLQGDWYQRSGADADDPDFTRRPRGVRPLIHFTRAGRFDDEGLFAVGITSRAGGDDRAGAGTYQVRDHSIIFRYDDGRVRQEAFPGCGPELSPATTKDDRIFIRTAGLLKR